MTYCPCTIHETGPQCWRILQQCNEPHGASSHLPAWESSQPNINSEATLMAFTHRWLKLEPKNTLVLVVGLFACNSLFVCMCSHLLWICVCLMVATIDKVWSRLVGSVAGWIFMRWSVCWSDKQPLLPTFTQMLQPNYPSITCMARHSNWVS